MTRRSVASPKERPCHKDSIEAIERGRLIEACDACPADALFVIEESGQQIVP